jgi:O-antigen/teichoic acid export membrane protein
MIKQYIYFLTHFGILFFINIYIANHYLAEIFGEYQFYTTLFLFLLALSQMGTKQSFIVLAPKVPNNIKLIYATLVLRLIGVSLLIIVLLFLFYILDVPNIAYVFLFLFIPQTMNFANILDYYKETIVDVKYNFYFDSLLFAVLVAILIELDYSILTIVFAKFISKSIAEFMKYRFIIKTFGKLVFSKKYLIWMYVKSKIFILNRIIVELYAKSEILLLGLIASKKELGLYAVAFTVYEAILIGEGLLARKLFPKLTKVYKDNLRVKNVLTLSIFYKTLYFLPAIAATFFIFNNIIFTYIYNPLEYSQSSVILDLMLIGIFSHIFANNTNYLLMMDDKTLYLKRFAVGLVLNLLLGYTFYQLYSLEGYTVAIQFVKVMMVMYSVFISYQFLNKELKNGKV